MERQLFLLIIILTGIWLILDEYAGQKRVTKFVQGVLGNG